MMEYEPLGESPFCQRILNSLCHQKGSHKLLPNMPEVPKYQTDLRVRRMAVDLLPFSAAAHKLCRHSILGWIQTFTDDGRAAVRLAEAFLTGRAATGAVIKALLN